MGKILIIYDTDSDRWFTETMDPNIKEGIKAGSDAGHSIDRADIAPGPTKLN